jgi:hypothetical protein
MAKPKRQCFGRGMSIHFGPCCDFWADDGMCICDPADAAEYPQDKRLYVAANNRGFSRPNIRTVFADGSDNVHTLNRGDYSWIWWEWGGYVGKVTFELRDGSSVRSSRSTVIAGAVPAGAKLVLNLPTGWLPSTAKAGDRLNIRFEAGCKETPSMTGYFRVRDTRINEILAKTDPITFTSTWRSYTCEMIMPERDVAGRFELCRDVGGSPVVDAVVEHRIVVKLHEPVMYRGYKLEWVYLPAVGRSEWGYWENEFSFSSYGQDLDVAKSYIDRLLACPEGEKRNQVPCWDSSTINTEVCRNGIWVPSGESCPVETTHGEKRSPSSCWDGSIIYAEKYDTTLHRWIPTGESCPTEPLHGEKRSSSPCWDGSIIYAEKYDTTLHRWIPSGESCPVMPAAGSKRNPKTCWDGSIIYAEKFDAASKTWIPTGEVCPAEPPAGAKRASETCWDGTVIYGEVFREGRWVSTGAKCPAMPTAGAKRSPKTCWDRSVIHTEIFSGGAWIPSGEACPEKLVRHTLEIAVPKIAYEGQPINIVARAFCGAASSHDEDANLTIDGAAIETKKTKAGEVSFRWTAKGVGMHKVCINIPASPSCQVPITECETMMVSAHVAGIQEQIKREKEAYEGRLSELRKRKKIAAGKTARPGVPGYVRVPASLAGSVINVGGVKVTVPPGGTTVQVPSGDSIVSVIREGIPTNVPVLVSPGEVINLPTGGLPGLPGGI